MKARFGRPYISLENSSSGCQQIYVMEYSSLSRATVHVNPPKMASSSSAVDDSVILTKITFPEPC